MVLYGMILFFMVDKIQVNYPGYLQSWCVDDFILEGACAHIKPAIDHIEFKLYIVAIHA